MASVRSVDSALGFTGIGTGAAQIPPQGNLLRNLIEGADLVMSHILHFYHLTALDYINTDYAGCPISGVAPWWPKDNTADMVSGATATMLILHYVAALNIRREAHRMAAYMDGKHPCQPALIPGGVTKTVDANLKNNILNLLGTTAAQANSGTQINSFIKHVYLPDVKAVAQAFSATLLAGNAAQGVGAGCMKYLAYGTFPNSAGTQLISGGFLDATGALGAWTASPLDQTNIKEYIKYSYYNEGGGAYTGLHPSNGVTVPQYGKLGAYSWLKAPRYVVGGTKHVCEVGPLARVLVNVMRGVGNWQPETSAFLQYLGISAAATGVAIPLLRSVLGRHAARALECDVVARAMTGWANALTTTATTGETYKHRNIPGLSTGYGLTEAPRGALGHWISVGGKKISSYQCVVPSTWNMGPKDDDGNLGPVEAALNGAVVDDSPSGRTKVGRIIRSFDPCIACAVHIVSPDKKTVSKFMVVDPSR